MNMIIKEFEDRYLQETTDIWNEVVREGIAFPQENELTLTEAGDFFGNQTYTAVALEEESGNVLGMYILHPNNIGRCGHIANASFAVSSRARGLHIGEKLVSDCLVQAKGHGFTIMQFNAVVDSNIHARHLYARLGFRDLGKIPHGFCMRDGHFEDIHVMVKDLLEQE